MFLERRVVGQMEHGVVGKQYKTAYFHIRHPLINFILVTAGLSLKFASCRAVELNVLAQAALRRFSQWPWIDHPTFQLRDGHFTTELSPSTILKWPCQEQRGSGSNAFAPVSDVSALYRCRTFLQPSQMRYGPFCGLWVWRRTNCRLCYSPMSNPVVLNL